MALSKTTLASATYTVSPSGTVAFSNAETEAVVYNNNLVVSPKVQYPGTFTAGTQIENGITQPEI